MKFHTKISTTIFAIILFNQVFAQDDRFYDQVQFSVYNSDFEIVKNATVLVDGVNVPYDSQRRIHYKEDTFKLNYDVIVFCEGYDTLRYNRKDLMGSQLWLIKPSEKYYYGGNGHLKIPYTPHPDKLLVVLKSGRRVNRDSLISLFEIKLQEFGLNNSFVKPPKNFTENWKYNSYVGIENRVIIKKQDSSNFESDFCKELAYLRELDMVRFAGPYINNGNLKYNLFSYDRLINIRNPLKYHTSEEIKSFLSQIDDRLYFDETTKYIVLPIETNEYVIHVMEELQSMGIEGEIYMVLNGMISKG